MKQVLTLITLITAFAITTFAQSEKIEVPKGITYHYADDSTNARSVAAIRTAFASGSASVIFGDSVICGPLLWDRYQRIPSMDWLQLVTGTDTSFNVPQYDGEGKVQGYEKLAGKLIRNKESFSHFWVEVIRDIEAGGIEPIEANAPKGISPLEAYKLIMISERMQKNGMEESNKAIDQKNNALLDSFVAVNDRLTRSMAKNDQNISLLDTYLNSANKAKSLAGNFVERVESLKKLIIHKSGGYVNNDPTSGNMVGKRNYDVPTRILVEQENGRDLGRAIQALRDSLLSLPGLNEEDRETLAKQFTLNTYYNLDAAKRLGKKSWEEYLFDHVPVIAVNTILTKFQGDAKNSAGLVIETLYRKTTAPGLTIRKLKPEELQYYSTLTSSTINEPIHIIEAGNVRLLFDLSNDMKLLWIEQMP